jgi:hypothetical protein
MTEPVPEVGGRVVAPELPPRPPEATPEARLHDLTDSVKSAPRAVHVLVCGGKPLDGVSERHLAVVIDSTARFLERRRSDPRRWKKSCSAICADTGNRCALPAHGEAVAHGYGRTKFVRVAASGQTVFPARAELEARAFSQSEPVIEETGAENRRFSARQLAKRTNQQQGRGK